MHEKPENLIYDFIIENEIATDAEISLVTNINGWNVESLNDIIWCRTEYHDAEQIYNCEKENFCFSEELLDYLGLNENEEDEEEE